MAQPTRADIARQRILAFLADTMDDAGYVEEDLLMRDVWILEAADFSWLLSRAGDAKLAAARRAMLSGCARDPAKSKQLMEAAR